MRMNQQSDIEDDEKGKLFVGGLSWETTQDSLQRYFSRYGEVIDCVVMKNNETGRSRGFGFVTFADPTNVGVVLQNGPHSLDGRTIDPKQCNPRTLQKDSYPQPKTRGGSYPKVFLGGLPSNVTETDLRMFFGRYGKVMEVVIMYDQEKKKSRGFGFLSFEDDAAVDRVCSEHYINLNGKQVEIKKAEPRDGSSNHKMPNEQGQAGSHWGPPGPSLGAMMQNPNGQMNAPQMNMAAAMSAPNAMMQGYQGWGTTPQQQSYGYGTPNSSSYQGWGAPPPQGPPPHQWSSYNASAQQAQAYGSYDMYNSSSAPNAASGGGNWNSWGLQANSGSAGSNDLYSRAQSGPPGASASGPPGVPPSGPGTTNSKAPSDYSGYGAGYGNYSNEQNSSYPRSYGNDITQQYPQQQQQDDFLKPY